MPYSGESIRGSSGEGAAIGVGLSERDGVAVGMEVAVEYGVGVVALGVGVLVAVGVDVGVNVGTRVGVAVEVAVGVGVGLTRGANGWKRVRANPSTSTIVKAKDRKRRISPPDSKTSLRLKRPAGG